MGSMWQGDHSTGGGGATTIADGADVNAGATTDAAITADSPGTLSGKLRGLVKIFSSVWDSVNSKLMVEMPLPTGAATSALQTTGNTSLSSIDAKLTNPLPVSAVALPLPTGAATSALQTTGNTSLSSIDAKLTNPLPVSATSLPLPAGAATDASLIAIEGLQSAGNVSLASIDTKLTNPLPVSATSLPLPAGAATEATLATLSAKIPPLGQALMAASLPVVLASDQSSLPVSFSGDIQVGNFPATQAVTNVDSTDVLLMILSELRAANEEAGIFSGNF